MAFWEVTKYLREGFFVSLSEAWPLCQPNLLRWLRFDFVRNFQKYQVPEVDKVKAMISSTPVDGYCGCSAAIMKLNLTSQLSQISIPTLVMVGENDPGTPVALHEVIQQEIAGSNLFVIPKALHFCNIEQSDMFNRKLIEFLTSITSYLLLFCL